MRGWEHDGRGFTLIELMIVVAIIGILAAIAIPQFALYRTRAFNSAAETDLRNGMTAEEAYYAVHLKYFTKPFPSSPTGSRDSTLAIKVSNNVALSLSAFGTDNFTASARHSLGNHTYRVTGTTGIIR